MKEQVYNEYKGCADSILQTGSGEGLGLASYLPHTSYTTTPNPMRSNYPQPIDCGGGFGKGVFECLGMYVHQANGLGRDMPHCWRDDTM